MLGNHHADGQRDADMFAAPTPSTMNVTRSQALWLINSVSAVSVAVTTGAMPSGSIVVAAAGSTACLLAVRQVQFRTARPPPGRRGHRFAPPVATVGAPGRRLGSIQALKLPSRTAEPRLSRLLPTGRSVDKMAVRALCSP